MIFSWNSLSLETVSSTKTNATLVNINACKNFLYTPVFQGYEVNTTPKNTNKIVTKIHYESRVTTMRYKYVIVMSVGGKKGFLRFRK